MRYNAETKKISITLGEFVSLARRGISPTLSRDEDEPRVSGVARRRLVQFFGKAEELSLSYEFSQGEYDFILTGRADGGEEDSIVVARSITGNPSKPKKNELSEIRGEGYILALMLAKAKELQSVKIDFLYVNEVSGESDIKVETVTTDRLTEFFNKCLVAVALFAAPEVDRVTNRLPSMKALKFPYDNIREGQSEFVRNAYRILSRGGTLYATAPTGTGKTVSALYPAIRALGDGRVDKVFYLTPKSTTAEAAADCLNIMAEKGGVIRSVILTAKEKICPMGHICRKAKRLCPRSAFNKLADAALSLWSEGRTVVGREEILEVADRFGLCPYELSLCYAEICDVVICDVNYLFDPVVYIKRFFDGGLHKVDKVGDRDILVYHHTLHLKEGILVASIGGLVSEASAGEDSAKRRAVLLHNSVLRRRGMSLKKLTVIKIISILHISRRVMLGNIKSLKALIIVNYLPIILDSKAHALKDLLNLSRSEGDGVIRAELTLKGKGGIVLFRASDLSGDLCRLHSLGSLGDAVLHLCLKRIDKLTCGLLILNVAKPLHKLGDVTLLSKISNSESLKLLSSLRGTECFREAGAQRFDSILHLSIPFTRKCAICLNSIIILYNKVFYLSTAFRIFC